MSTDSVKNVNSLNTTDSDPYNFENYVIKKTVYLTLARGAENAHNLTVKPTIAKKAGAAQSDVITAAKVLVATGDNYTILDTTKNDAAQSLHGATDTTLTDSSVVTVDIYIYYDGSDASVTTNNKANLAEADIELEFGVDVGSGS